MRGFMMMAAAATLTLAGHGALAEQRPDGPPPECRQQDRTCPPPARQGKAGKRDDRPAPPARKAGDDRRDDLRRDGHDVARRDGHLDPRRDPPPQRRAEDGRDRRPEPRQDDRQDDRRPVPRVGENARDGRPWTPPRDSRIARAPQGQEYRVIGDHLVMVDKKSHRILSVVAPVSPR